jgi:hypothetical protein
MSTPGPPEQEVSRPTPPYDKDEPPVQEDPISRSSGTSDDPEWPGRVVSDEERTGMSDTDTEPEPPLGVGEHLTAAGEERSVPGAGVEGRKGAAARPHGEQPDESGMSEQRDETDTSAAGEPGDQAG